LLNQAGDEGVPARVEDEPTMPLQLVERGCHLRNGEIDGVGELVQWDSIPEDRGNGKDLLGERCEPPKSNPDGRSDCIWKLSRQRLLECLQRLRPGTRHTTQIEAESDSPEQLHNEQRDAGGIGGDTANDPLDFHITELRQHVPGKGVQSREIEWSQTEHRTTNTATQLGA